jgi:molecular chaperone Hsp33
MAAAGTLMQSNIKFNGALMLQIFGDGPVKVVVAEVQHDLSLRATAKVVGDVPADARLPDWSTSTTRAAAPSRSSPRAALPGQQPYQGVVPLFGDRAREARQAQRRAAALHAAERAARHHAGAGGRRQGGRGPPDPAPAGQGRGQPRGHAGWRPQPGQRRRDRPQRALQPHRDPGLDAHARRTADARCRDHPAPSVLGREAAALRAAAGMLGPRFACTCSRERVAR